MSKIKVKELNNKHHLKSITNLIQKVAQNRSVSRVFTEFLEMSAITIANSLNLIRDDIWDKREKRYIEIIRSYSKEHQKLFPEMFGYLVQELEKRATTTGPEDVLGHLYYELGLSDKLRAQLFTPQNISDCMARMIIGEGIIPECGYISMAEPSCGSGVMLTSMCKAMRDIGLNYNKQLLVIATDIDIVCVHMTYLQLSLYGVPAVVIHGNSLTGEEWSRWQTPLYTLHGWQ